MKVDLKSKLAISATPYQVQTSHQESAYNYHSVIVRSAKFRVIICKNNWQWIIQQRAGFRHGGPRWDGLSYCRSRKTLLKLWRGLNRLDGGASVPQIEALPKTFKGFP